MCGAGTPILWNLPGTTPNPLHTALARFSDDVKKKSPEPMRLLIPFLLAGLLFGCDTAPRDEAGQGAFVTVLGEDTLAVERFRHVPEGMEAEVVLRTPVTTVHRYRLELDEAGQLRRFEATVREATAPPEAPPSRQEVATFEGDSLVIVTTAGEETRRRALAAPPDVLPFLDMIHWPFELVLMRARAAGADSLVQPLFAGSNVMSFVVRRAGPDSMTVTHPFRGTMGVRVDAAGRLVELDASGTTRKLRVRRQPAVDLEALAERFAARDAAGQSFGPLSTRGEARATVHGATIVVDYGVPYKRGREIFGALVPWGEVWRTGANRATHLTTDRPLVFGELQVPAGTYTLFTIPQPDGGLLIINRQTGQGGTSYDPERDLGRVPMQRRELDAVVEPFTILVDETPAGGLLRLQWDRTEFVVPFRAGR
ncbi:MAG: hypothetical protein KatS3mg043_0903 [Rhodothermaceae bacterium]|nr:MAG: hypothetical protein KatS3mg043_0903 [Rhodothermaceae bacterium]